MDNVLNEYNTLNGLFEQASKITNPEDGHLIVSDYLVCKSNAGHYVGTWCIEYVTEDDEWFPQPYSRDTGYMQQAIAHEVLKSMIK